MPDKWRLLQLCAYLGQRWLTWQRGSSISMKFPQVQFYRGNILICLWDAWQFQHDPFYMQNTSHLMPPGHSHLLPFPKEDQQSQSDHISIQNTKHLMLPWHLHKSVPMPKINLIILICPSPAANGIVILHIFIGPSILHHKFLHNVF